LMTQEEMEAADISVESIETDDEAAPVKAKVKAIPGESEDDAEEEEEVQEAPTQITDSVKSYLRDIGKIPLLNKKTETAIAEKISSAKQESIDAISHLPFLHKEFISIGDRLSKNTLALKDVIQFSEFDEDNLPKIEQEKATLLKTIKKINTLVDNEEKIYRSYRGKLDSIAQKKAMLQEVKDNTESNTLSAFPVGYREDHFINQNEDIEYTTYFQNTDPAGWLHKNHTSLQSEVVHVLILI